MRRLILFTLLSLPALADNGHYLIDFGYSGNSQQTTVMGWTNFTDIQEVAKSSISVVDSTGAATSVTVQAVTTVSSSNCVNNSFLGATGTGLYPDTATGDYFFASTAGYNSCPGTWEFNMSGLNSSKTYNWKLYCSRTGVADNRTTLYTVGTAQASLNCANNTTGTVTISNVAPSSGTIHFKMEVGAGNNSTSGFSYINVIEVTSQDRSQNVRRRWYGQ